MNEFLRQFIMEGIRDMIARDVALYQTYQYASGWFAKGVLLQEDLEEIQRLYAEKEKPVEDANIEEDASYTEQDAPVQPEGNSEEVTEEDNEAD